MGTIGKGVGGEAIALNRVLYYTRSFFKESAMPTATTSRYITRNPDILSGEPIIAGTRTSVRAIVENWRLGIRPEEIPLHLPHLTLAQVFDALSFYLDNQTEINKYIELNHVPDNLVHPVIQARLNLR